MGFDEATAPDVNTKQVDMMLPPPGRAVKVAMFHRAKRTLGPRTAMKAIAMAPAATINGQLL